MDRQLFAELVESMMEMNAIARGERAASRRVFQVVGADLRGVHEDRGIASGEEAATATHAASRSPRGRG